MSQMLKAQSLLLRSQRGRLFFLYFHFSVFSDGFKECLQNRYDGLRFLLVAILNQGAEFPDGRGVTLQLWIEYLPRIYVKRPDQGI